MGGKLLVLAGDFRQTLPIIPRGTRADEINAPLKSSKLLWPHVQTLRLRKNMRVHMYNDIDAAAHANLLLSIGNGQIPVNPHNGLIRIPCGKLVYTLQQLLDRVSFLNYRRIFTTSPGYPNVPSSPQQTIL